MGKEVVIKVDMKDVLELLSFVAPKLESGQGEAFSCYYVLVTAAEVLKLMLRDMWIYEEDSGEELTKRELEAKKWAKELFEEYWESDVKEKV